MPKSLVLGNGNMLVGFDHRGQVKDLYYPYVGLENHVGGYLSHRIGVFTDGVIKWFSDPSWKIEINLVADTFASNIKATNDELGVELQFNDVVYNEKTIFVRKVTVYNLRDGKRTFKIFFGAEFDIYESYRGDTAYFDPIHKTVIHYKGRRTFLINAKGDNFGIEDFSIGQFGVYGKEGSFKDAEDGKLSGNPIEHGRVDSVIGVSVEVESFGNQVFYYWMVVAKSIQEAYDLNGYVLTHHPQHLLRTTQDFWTAWVNRQTFNFYGLSEPVVELFKKSLFYMRANVDNRGAIVASCDSDMLQHGHDTYAYMWPRDGALSAITLDKAGDFNVARRFFEFCNATITEDGYFMHKYRADQSLGSSWHPWMRDGKMELPIQEDETALVIYALWEHYQLTKDLEFIEDLYNSLIKKAADFMVGFTYSDTGLSYPSYDLWEEKFGISTFSSSAKYASLLAAGKFAKLLGKTKAEEKYNEAAGNVRNAILKYLYNEADGTFYKLVIVKDKEIIPDKTLDMSSLYGLFRFDVLDPADPMMKSMVSECVKRLTCQGEVGGLVRYENDYYFRVSNDHPGNPWFITSLWLAQYYIKAAKTESELKVVKDWLEWSVKYALPSGVLSEQLNPLSGEQLSATPLTWSHSEYIVTIVSYLEKLEELGVCKACLPWR